MSLCNQARKNKILKELTCFYLHQGNQGVFLNLGESNGNMDIFIKRGQHGNVEKIRSKYSKMAQRNRQTKPNEDEQTDVYTNLVGCQAYKFSDLFTF